MSKKVLKGIVMSTKSANTLVVSVALLKEHSKYKKRFVSNKKYKAHYETGEYKVGDKVTIEESRPISKDKRWRVLGLVIENDVAVKKNSEEKTLIAPTPEGRSPDSSDDVEKNQEEVLNKEI